jgi:hypothetical protein
VRFVCRTTFEKKLIEASQTIVTIPILQKSSEPLEGRFKIFDEKRDSILRLRKVGSIASTPSVIGVSKKKLIGRSVHFDADLFRK